MKILKRTKPNWKTKYCEFGKFLEETLRDKFISGLKLDRIKQRLLSEDKLTFEKACEIVTRMELAEYQTRIMMLGWWRGYSTSQQIEL